LQARRRHHTFQLFHELVLAIGAVTLDPAIIQASATVEGVVSLRLATSMSASTIRSPRSFRYLFKNGLRARLSMSAFERYFPLRKPLARLKYVTTARLCKQLIKRIDRFVSHYNENCKPLMWTASADSILEKLALLKTEWVTAFSGRAS
jgi:hypothetical protein